MNRRNDEVWYAAKELHHLLGLWIDGEELTRAKLTKLMDSCNVVWSEAAAAERLLERGVSPGSV